MGRPKLFDEQPKDMRIALLELDFGWSVADVQTIKEMYNDGKPMEEMAAFRYKVRPSYNGTTKKERLEDAQDEVVLLIMDLARKNEIKPRKGGIV